jgi:transcription initiation factor TFIID subunit 8
MPGIIYSPSDSIAAAVAGMKRPFEIDDTRVPTYGEPHPKKQKVAHRLHHMQPVQHIIDPVSAELADFGGCKEFFDQQVRRAIAIECKSAGFESARPEALEEFRALVDSCTASLATCVASG